MRTRLHIGDVGWSPFMEENISTAQASPTRHQRLLLFGETNGTITGVEWNGSASR